MTEAAGAVAAIADAVRGGVTTATAVADAALQSAERSSNGALVSIERDAVLAQSRDLDVAIARGDPVGPLAGVPFVVKDNIDVVGWLSTSCTPALADNRATHDAEVVARLRAAGAIMLGKAAMHQLAMGGTSNNPHMPPVRNPAAPGRIAGGSSGGSAVAIAEGLCPFALGHDTGGSVPIPAAFCNVAGLRPSVGRYSRRGLLAGQSARDTIGPLGLTVADLRLVDSVITGEPIVSLPAVSAIRLGIERSLFWSDLEPSLEAALLGAIDALRVAGVELVEIDAPTLPALSAAAGEGLRLQSRLEYAAALAALPRPVTIRDLRDRCTSPAIQAMLDPLLGGDRPEREVRAALEVHRPALAAALDHAMSGLDALLVPTVILPPPPDDTGDTVLHNGREAPLLTVARNTIVAANAGLPMVTFPAGRTASGLPAALSLIGRASADQSMMAAAQVLEQLLARH